ncbi:hypothetical protein [Streptomyces ardesiacus]|uniref:hypothetical protein n=1 Tax=Streptomyces ardesiacus TaxID=285564 RepID=UPI0037FB36F5
MKATQFAIGLRVKGKNLEGFKVGGFGTPAYIVGATHKPGRFSKKTVDLVVIRQEPFRGMFTQPDPSEKPEYHICKFEDLKAVEK